MVENVVAEKIFESSGTGGPVSRHLVADIHLYEESFTRGFERFYGPPEEWIILALLPSYLERGHSSLVFMVDELIRKTGSPDSGFYLHNLPELAEQLERLKGRSQKVILIGVTYALLDFAEQYPMDLSGVCIMETGGMKGRRKEQTREAVHEVLKKQFRTEHIHSEYGMTELLSQAYSSGEGIFKAPPWMKVYRRDLYDPLQVSAEPGRGALNVIDLANLYSCCFIATQDLVNIRKDGNFEVLGRTDNADIRGCNLMVSL